MMYKALCEWRDLQDEHTYQAGDEYPFDGRAIKPERIEQLLSGNNLARKPLIVKVEEAVKEEPKDVPEAKPKRRKTVK